MMQSTGVPNSWYKDKDELSVSEYWKKYNGICYKCGVPMEIHRTEKDRHVSGFYECPVCGWAVADRGCLSSTPASPSGASIVEYDNDEIPW